MASHALSAPPPLRLGICLLLIGLSLPWILQHRQRGRLALPKTGALRPELVELPSGTFQMGSSPDDPDHLDNEVRHTVSLHAFAISRTEITQAQFAQVTGEHPSHFHGDDLPVESISWDQAVRYCNQLTQLEQARGVKDLTPCYEGQGDTTTWKAGCTGYRLLTEAEWEYAARAQAPFRYAGSDKPEEVAWFGEDYDKGSTHKVGEKQANAWSLYDMSGNVWEWVWDWHEEKYDEIERADPRGPQSDTARVYRGGSFVNSRRNLRVTFRRWNPPGDRSPILGFRVARSLP